MIFRLDDDLFRPGLADPVALSSLLGLAQDGRHLVLTRLRPDDPQAELVNAWLKQNGPLGEMQRRLVNDSFLRAPSLSYLPRVRVTVAAHSSWALDPPELSLTDALRLAQMPLRLLVESRFSDVRFLRCALPDLHGKDVLLALERNWIEAEHGGGLPTMKLRVEELTSDPAGRLRTYVLSDRDCFCNATPSPPAAALEKACREGGLAGRHHMLERNESENYLPREALVRWATGAGGSKPPEVKRANVYALDDVPYDQRRHVDYKAAFEHDVGRLFGDHDVRKQFHRWVKADEGTWAPGLRQADELTRVALEVLALL